MHNEQSVIETLAFVRTNMDGMPHSSNHGSITEYAVLNKERIQNEEKRHLHTHIQRLQKEMAELKCYSALYEACMNAFTETEKQIVKWHFQEHVSLEEISNRPIGEMMYSLSTIRRNVAQILGKAEKITGL